LPSRIEYKASVERDLRHLPAAIAARILDKLEEVLGSQAPRLEAFHGEFAGMFKIRVGDYRVICSRTADAFSCCELATVGTSIADRAMSSYSNPVKIKSAI